MFSRLIPFATLFFGLLGPLSLHAQLVGGNIGLNYNTFSCRSNAIAEERTAGYVDGFQLSLEDLDAKGMILGLAIPLERYQGSFRKVTRGPSGAQVEAGFTKRLQRGVGLYPLQLVFFEKLQFQLGAELNILLNERTTEAYASSYPGGYMEVPYTNTARKFHNITTLGAVEKVAYRSPLKTNCLLTPQVRYQYGLQLDMSGAGSIYSPRAVFACGLPYKINESFDF